LAKISQRLYDDRVYEEEKHHYHSSHFKSNILPPIVHQYGLSYKGGNETEVNFEAPSININQPSEE
jgi:hypothetical protein